MRRILVLMRHGSQPKFLVPAHMEVFGDNRVEHKRRPICSSVGETQVGKRASWTRGGEEKAGGSKLGEGSGVS